ncbi:MAG TPA: DUF1587 domain-containing protein, partial [Schlesneria sp.]
MYLTLVRITFLCVIFVPTAVRAAEIGDSTQLFFAKHCLACHSDDTKEGGLDLKAMTGKLSDRADVERWTRIYDRVAMGEMPPEGEPRPDAALQRAFLASIATPLKAADSQLREVVQRRLNREEYQYTVRDLLGLDIELKQLLPEDQQAGGFDNNGEALAISAELMGQYLKAAETAIDAAIVHGDQPQSTTFVVDPGSEVKNDIPKFFGIENGRTVIYTTDNGNYS